MFLIKNFMKLALCLLLIFKNSHAFEKKNTKNLKDQIYDVRTHAGPMGMGLTKSYQINNQKICVYNTCLLYTSPSPRDATTSRMPSSA